MILAYPKYLILFILYIPILIWYIKKFRNSDPTIGISSISPLKNMPKSYKDYLRHLLFVFRLIAIGCLIIVLARPQKINNWKTTLTDGTDIVLSIDISSSMLAKDFTPNRLEAAKNVASKFVSGRETDNMGLVIFAAEGFTGVPMTTDRSILISYINGLEVGQLEDGTAIGDGLSMAINRIKDGPAKSKSIILLTDGSNNTGIVAPLTAAKIAKKYNIKVYTIGVGSNGEALYPTTDVFGQLSYIKQKVVIDEETLTKIAETTGGSYFRATDDKMLEAVFHEIDKLEKSKIDVKHFTHTEDNYMIWAWFALIFFVSEIMLRYTILRSIP
ncbi:MAG: VWA domain-containing protein [Bacteroidales bacterium]|nr:VWA domain-containing protein [Bacteroidales bacterium]